MKFTQEEFKKYINAEVKKIALAEGWIQSPLFPPSDDTEAKTAAQKIVPVSGNEVKEKTVNVETANLKEEFETVNSNNEIIVDSNLTAKEEPKEVIKDVKNLNEELKRMKELVDFRSPMLGQI